MYGLVVNIHESLLFTTNILYKQLTLEELAFIFALRIVELDEDSFNIEIHDLFKRFLSEISSKCQDFEKVIKIIYKLCKYYSY